MMWSGGIGSAAIKLDLDNIAPANAADDDARKKERRESMGHQDVNLAVGASLY
jgi:hypothetical protein